MNFIKLNVVVAEIDTWVNVAHIVQFYSNDGYTTVQLSTPMTLENGSLSDSIDVVDSPETILSQIKKIK